MAGAAPGGSSAWREEAPGGSSAWWDEFLAGATPHGSSTSRVGVGTGSG
jgi:hypothetical protein